jgi:glycosyltransferase involved in cell wall biosynthesis
LSLPGEKVDIINNGVRTDDSTARLAQSAARLRLGLPARGTILASVAVLRPEKDHVSLLRALRVVIDAGQNPRLLIVGDGSERENLLRETERLGLGKSVMFLGHRSDVDDLIAASDIVLLSSYAVECFPYALLEAMRGARPVISTAVGGIPEMVEDGLTGYLVPPHAPLAMADRILDLMKHPDLAREMGIAGAKRVGNRFTLERSADRTAAALRALLA